MEANKALEIYKLLLLNGVPLKQKLPFESKNTYPLSTALDNSYNQPRFTNLPFMPTRQPHRGLSQPKKRPENPNATFQTDSLLYKKNKAITADEVLAQKYEIFTSNLQISSKNDTIAKKILLAGPRKSKVFHSSAMVVSEHSDVFKSIESSLTLPAADNSVNKSIGNMLENDKSRLDDSPIRNSQPFVRYNLPKLKIRKLEKKGAGKQDTNRSMQVDTLTSRTSDLTKEEEKMPLLIPLKKEIQSRPFQIIPKTRYRTNSPAHKAVSTNLPSTPISRPRTPFNSSAKVQNTSPEKRKFSKKVDETRYGFMGNSFIKDLKDEEIKKPPSVTAKSWALFSSDRGFLMGKQENKTREVASLTKIMTCYICLKVAESKGINLKEQKVRVSKHAAFMIGTSANLKAGDVFNAIDLLYGLMLPSGNDAAYALAEHFGRVLFPSSPECRRKCEEKCLPPHKIKCNKPVRFFLREMNRVAREFGMNDTNYTNPHGLPDMLNLSTAKDQGELSLRALKDSTFREIVNTQRYTAIALSKERMSREYTWDNTNQLLGRGYDGVKTGTTLPAGNCLVSSLCRGRRTIVCVVLNSSTTDTRFFEAMKLTDFSLELL